jgi:Skp family chaperone for outer membrane proteins
MRNYFLIIVALIGFTMTSNGQGRGVKIGYIDMEYILQNIPDYTEAKNQLEQKAQRWKQEIEVKSIELKKLEESLKTERVLLTKELIAEREEEIEFQRKEFLDYQDKRFGPRGDLIIQKTVLVQPVQDQVFTAAQDIAEAKKYDFIFDKTSDLTMLFAAKRFDISDQVIRVITRSAKREQLSKKELKAEADKDAKQEQEDNIKENPALADRQKALEDKKLAREKLLAERKLASDAKKLEIEEARKKLLEDKANKKNGTVIDNPSKEDSKTEPTTTENKTVVTPEKAEQDAARAAEKQRIAEERIKNLEEKKKVNEAKRAQILAEREAARKARLEKEKEDKEKK